MKHALKIGRYEVPYPLIQGGMGVRISGSRLAGNVALCGGVGIVASAGLGLDNPDFRGDNFSEADALAMKYELKKAYEIAPDGIIGTNCMVAVADYEENVRASCEGGAKIIVSGAGLPLNLPKLTEDFPEVALVPIVSSVRAAELIVRKWLKSYQRLPDAVVVEDPDTAGGHLGEKMEKIGLGDYDQYATVRGVKALLRATGGKRVPVIAAGGVWDRNDLLHALDQGADGVQMASRFVCTEECDADEAYKQAYLECTKGDIDLMISPVGLPGRAIVKNIENISRYDREAEFICPVKCLKKCSYREKGTGFCIVHALNRAQQGHVDTGLIFCGSNAWKADRISTVAEIFNELFDIESLEFDVCVENG
jgi:NAD(P)H-dependent flavin oxidoreductase YrpB (nitropropane dioxygenase family)